MHRRRIPFFLLHPRVLFAAAAIWAVACAVTVPLVSDDQTIELLVPAATLALLGAHRQGARERARYAARAAERDELDMLIRERESAKWREHHQNQFRQTHQLTTEMVSALEDCARQVIRQDLRVSGAQQMLRLVQEDGPSGQAG